MVCLNDQGNSGQKMKRKSKILENRSRLNVPPSLFSITIVPRMKINEIQFLKSCLFFFLFEKIKFENYSKKFV